MEKTWAGGNAFCECSSKFIFIIWMIRKPICSLQLHTSNRQSDDLLIKFNIGIPVGLTNYFKGGHPYLEVSAVTWTLCIKVSFSFWSDWKNHCCRELQSVRSRKNAHQHARVHSTTITCFVTWLDKRLQLVCRWLFLPKYLFHLNEKNQSKEIAAM